MFGSAGALGEAVAQANQRELDERFCHAWMLAMAMAEAPVSGSDFKGRMRACESLLALGARIDARESATGQSFLCALCARASELPSEWFDQALCFILSRGGSAMGASQKGDLALCALARQGDPKALWLFFQRAREFGCEVDVHARGADKRGALMHATLARSLGCVRELLERGARPLLGAGGARCEILCALNYGEDELALALCEVVDWGLGRQTPEARGMLGSAAAHGCVKALRLLLAQGVEPAEAVEAEDHALTLAAQDGHYACVRALIEHGAPWNELPRLQGAVGSARARGHAVILSYLEGCVKSAQDLEGIERAIQESGSISPGAPVSDGARVRL